MATEFDEMRTLLNQYGALDPIDLVSANTPHSFALFDFARQFVRNDKRMGRAAKRYQQDKTDEAKAELDNALILHNDLANLIAEAVRMYHRGG